MWELEQLRTALELANGARDELEVATRMDLARFKKEAAGPARPDHGACVLIALRTASPTCMGGDM